MRTAVGRDDAVRIARDVLVEEDRLLRQLDDLARRADARDTGLAAVEDGIGAALVVREVLHLGEQRRLVGRPRLGGLHALHRARAAMTRALVDLLNGDLAVDLFLQRRGRAIDRVAPDAAQIRMPRLLREHESLRREGGCNNSEKCLLHRWPHFASLPLTSS